MPRAVSDSLPDSPAPIRTSDDFRRVLREGRRIRKADLTVVVASSNAAEPRLGLVTPRRLGGAVVRNRIRRRIREAARAAELSAGDYVVIPERSAATTRFESLVRQLHEAGR